MVNLDYLNKLEDRLVELEKLISNTQIISDKKQLSEYLKEHGKILPVVEKYREYKNTKKQISELDEIILKENPQDELKKLVVEEKEQLQIQLEKISSEIEDLLKEKDKNRGPKSIIVEIRAGTGGEEAALFSADLFRMYTKYAESKNYKVELIDHHSTGLKGFKEIIFSVEGDDAYENFKFESGIHRVQRIPVTETGGRIHTSTATVAVLQEPEEIELEIKPDELKIDTFRASGHGGQHLQKTDSAVRITHIPTGIVAQCQDERSQIKNREKAMKLLRAKLYQLKLEEQQTEISTERRRQIGSGKRAEKIRTYNFLQNRVTDHRINFSIYDLENILDGKLDPLIEELKKRNVQD